jgi:hypothetical protein
MHLLFHRGDPNEEIDEITKMAHIKKQDLPPKHSHSQEEVIQPSQQRPRGSLI